MEKGAFEKATLSSVQGYANLIDFVSGGRKVLGIFGLFVVVFTITALFNKNFITPFNIENLIQRVALFGFISIGAALVIITGGIDLSIGSVVGLIGVLLAMFLHVQYKTIDEYSLVYIDSDDRSITVLGGVGDLKPGDRLGFRASPSAQTEVFTVKGTQGVKVELDGVDVPATSITVDEKPAGSSDKGAASRVIPTMAVDAEASTLRLPGEYKLSAGDQIMISRHADLKRKTLIVAEAAISGGDTLVTVGPGLTAQDKGSFASIAQRLPRMPVPLAITYVLLISIGIGLLHGLLITKMRLQPFIVTLCGLLFYRGLARTFAGDNSVGFGNEYEGLRQVAIGKIQITSDFGLPVAFIIMALVAATAMVFLNMTIYGRYLLALGRNAQAARFSGINADRMVITAYILCAFLAGVGAIFFALDVNSIQPSNHGTFYELFAIAAAVLGGCSVRGGEGSIVGVIIGAAVLRLLLNSINMLGIPSQLEYCIMGAVILAGVIADELVKRYAARRRAIREAKTATGA